MIAMLLPKNIAFFLFFCFFFFTATFIALLHFLLSLPVINNAAQWKLLTLFLIITCRGQRLGFWDFGDPRLRIQASARFGHFITPNPYRKRGVSSQISLQNWGIPFNANRSLYRKRGYFHRFHCIFGENPSKLKDHYTEKGG